MAASSIPMPKDADDAALKAIDEVRLQDPHLPRPDAMPMVAGPGPLTLSRAVEVAIANNNLMQALREGARATALGMIAAQRNYYPQWRAQLNAVHSDAGVTFNGIHSADQYSNSFQSLGFTQQLPFGGNLSLDFGGSFADSSNTADSSYSPRAVLSLTQPLLSGAGRDLQQEPLVRAKRNVVYALRGYRQQQEDFAISAINDFLTIQVLSAKLQNLQARREAVDFLARKQQTFFKLGRETELEALRATQECLMVQQQLLDMDLDRRNRVEQFWIATLNLPFKNSVSLADFPIPYRKLQISSDKAVQTAMERRPDLQTAADLLEDSQRALKFAQRNLLPDLELNVSANVSNANFLTSNGATYENYTAGLTMSLPLESTAQRLALYTCWLAVRQNERALAYNRTSISASIRSSINRIKLIESALEIQESIIQSGGKRVAAAQFLLERGQVSNREVIDADNIRISAINTKLDLQMDHYVALLRLERDMGVFDRDQPSLFATTKP
ncbi:MAG: TolC family protein [Verrucomicrobiota bacterium]